VRERIGDPLGPRRAFGASLLDRSAILEQRLHEAVLDSSLINH
jgi:hypothetical protein